MSESKFIEVKYPVNEVKKAAIKILTMASNIGVKNDGDWGVNGEGSLARFRLKNGVLDVVEQSVQPDRNGLIPGIGLFVRGGDSPVVQFKNKAGGYEGRGQLYINSQEAIKSAITYMKNIAIMLQTGQRFLVKPSL